MPLIPAGNRDNIPFSASVMLPPISPFSIAMWIVYLEEYIPAVIRQVLRR